MARSLVFFVVAGSGIVGSMGVFSGCSSGSGSESGSGVTTASTAVVDAPPSPFSVVLEAKNALVLSGLQGGVAVAEGGKAEWALGLDGGELSPAPMPKGLPEGDGRVVRFAGKAPGSVWMTYEIPGEDKKGARHPLFRLDTKKGEWKQYAEDWRPLLSVWSKGQVVAASTSSGKLKIKQMEPYSKKAPPGFPNPKIEDASCQKGLRVEGFSALASGTFLMAGSCKPEGASGKRYVILQWRPGEGAPAASASSSAATAKSGAPATASATGSASAAVPSATASASVAVSGSASASAAPSGTPEDPGKEADPEESTEPPGKVFVVPGVDVALVHRSLSVASDSEVWALAEEEKSKKAHLFRFDGAKVEEVALPALNEPARAISFGKDGTLWLVTERAIWKRAGDQAWQSVPPPNAAFPEAEPTWEMFEVIATGSEVWVSAKHASKVASRYLLLRLRPAKSPVKWM